MDARDVAATGADIGNDAVSAMVEASIPENSLPEQWDIPALHAECLRLLALDLPLAEWAQEEGIDGDAIEERIIAAADRHMAEKAANVGADLMRMAEKSLLLQILDQTWKDHLLSLDHLRQGINLRAYAQRDPLNEYKREAFEMFETMLAGLRETVTSVLCHVELRRPSVEAAPQQAIGEMDESSEDAALIERATGTTGRRVMASAGGFGARTVPMGTASTAAAPGVDPRTPRNAPCPCGSGKKYKHCHGRV